MCGRWRGVKSCGSLAKTVGGSYKQKEIRGKEVKSDLR